MPLEQLRLTSPPSFAVAHTLAEVGIGVSVIVGVGVSVVGAVEVLVGVAVGVGKCVLVAVRVGVWGRRVGVVVSVTLHLA